MAHGSPPVAGGARTLLGGAHHPSHVRRFCLTMPPTAVIELPGRFCVAPECCPCLGELRHVETNAVAVWFSAAQNGGQMSAGTFSGFWCCLKDGKLLLIVEIPREFHGRCHVFRRHVVNVLHAFSFCF